MDFINVLFGFTIVGKSERLAVCVDKPFSEHFASIFLIKIFLFTSYNKNNSGTGRQILDSSYDVKVKIIQ